MKKESKPRVNLVVNLVESFNKSSSKDILRFSSSIECEADSDTVVNSELEIEFNKGTEYDSGEETGVVGKEVDKYKAVGTVGRSILKVGFDK